MCELKNLQEIYLKRDIRKYWRKQRLILHEKSNMASKRAKAPYH
jgi:hypothetical protein